MDYLEIAVIPVITPKKCEECEELFACVFVQVKDNRATGRFKCAPCHSIWFISNGWEVVGEDD